MDLEKDFDALEGCGDDGLGDCGEEAGSADLGDGELAVFDGGDGLDELFADAVALRWVVSCELLVIGFGFGGHTQKETATTRKSVKVLRGSFTREY